MVLTEEEKTNKPLIAVFRSDQTPYTTLATHITVSNAPAPNQPLIVSLYDCFPNTSVKIQIIPKNNKNDSV